jgi:hypothetical protein
MKNLGSGMDGILKMIIGILAICGVLIVVVTNVNLSGGSTDLPAPESNTPPPMPGQIPGQIPGPPGSAPQAVPSPAAAPLPGTTAQSATPAVPATPSQNSFSPAGRAFGDPMMDPSPIGLDGRPMGSQSAPTPEVSQPSGPQAPAGPDGNQQAPVGPPPPAL